jgi:acyl carrier protein
VNDDLACQVVVEAITTVAPDTDPTTVDPDEDIWYALDLDSMDQLNVMAGISERTGLEIPEVDYPKLRTLSGMTAYLAAAPSQP